MKSTRKAFLAAAAVVGASMTVSKEAALAQSAPSPTPLPALTAHPPTAHPPSAAARALAERMRAFDPHLDDAQLARIADGIQEGFGLGGVLNPKGTKLKNGDAPTPEFRVGA